MKTTFAALAVVLLTCPPATAQNIANLPNAATLTGAEKLPALQGTGCPTKTSPCTTVAVTPAQVATYIGTTSQPTDADLTAIAALATQPFGRSLLTQADAASARTTFGLGSLATQSGTFSGSSTGTNTGDQTSVTGNAGTATKLATARTIAGTSFDGTANITITDAALTGAAWTTYTPTVTPNSGSYTSVSATGRYKQIGKTVSFAVQVTITTNGTAAGAFYFTLPTTGLTTISQLGVCRETAVVGFMGNSQLTTLNRMIVLRYDNTYLGGDGYTVVCQGTYETV